MLCATTLCPSQHHSTAHRTSISMTGLPSACKSEVDFLPALGNCSCMVRLEIVHLFSPNDPGQANKWSNKYALHANGTKNIVNYLLEKRQHDTISSSGRLFAWSQVWKYVIGSCKTTESCSSRICKSCFGNLSSQSPLLYLWTSQ